VEFGQIAALLIAYPIILILRGDSFKRLSTLINWGLIVCGMFLLAYQLNGYFSDINHEEDHSFQVEVHEHNTEVHSHEDSESHSHDGENTHQH
jgi:hypothetical protein